jgi:hypothetical protein
MAFMWRSHGTWHWSNDMAYRESQQRAEQVEHYSDTEMLALLGSMVRDAECELDMGMALDQQAALELGVE